MITLIDSTNIEINLWPFRFWMRPKRMVVHWWQRRTRGWDDSETWNMEHSLAETILPRLKRFREVTVAYPGGLESPEQWDEILGKMIAAFEIIARKDDMWAWEFDKNGEPGEDRKIVEEGLDLFREYYLCLWW